MSRFLRIVADRGVLAPADPYTAEIIDGLEPGREFAIDLKNTRKLGTLNDWWAGLSYMVMRWQGTGDKRALLYPSARKLNDAVLIKLGYVEPWYHLDGTVHYRADSIRFEAIRDEHEFKQIMEAARVLALQYWGLDPWEEWKDAKARYGGGRDWRRNWRPGDE